MYVQQLWRYPVKSLKGEALEGAILIEDGIHGDRLVHVRRPNGRVITSRTHPRLLGLRGTLATDGTPLVDGHRWDSAEATALVQAAAVPAATLAYYDGPERFDILPLLVATDGAIAAFGEDGRRLRPNIVIGGVQGMTEREWPGRELHVGGEDGPIIRVDSPRARCVMTTYHPDTQVQDLNILNRIVREFDGELALNCAVVRPGTIRTGDPVRLV
jgi:uncharacterized protein